MKKGIVIAMVFLLCATPVRADELTVTDKGWLKLIAMAEAEGEGIEGKAAVMRVVLNRVEDERYPDTITEVLFEKNQFSTVSEGGRIWDTKPDKECEQAVALISNGYDNTQGAIFFNSCNEKAGKYLFTLGNHKFYK